MRFTCRANQESKKGTGGTSLRPILASGWDGPLRFGRRLCSYCLDDDSVNGSYCLYDDFVTGL